MRERLLAFLRIFGPGMLVAATGVGAADLATASFAGSHYGTAILWAVVVGAFLKFVVNEGLARWQLATGTTLLEGVAMRLGRPTMWLFMPYLVLWSFFTGTAMMSGCGVTLHALIPVFDDPAHGKAFFGIAASVIGYGCVWYGGYRLFEKLMAVCIGIMFITVVVMAIVLWPGIGEIARGLFIPSIPDDGGLGIQWTVALIGGVGGTVTILSYSYWIREEGRTSPAALTDCRIDLAAGYLMTALFGLSVVIIGSTVDIARNDAGMLVALSDQLQTHLGPIGRWMFLLGVLGAVFSSLLGVWQATPYIFADTLALIRGRDAGTSLSTAAPAYRWYLFAMATLPAIGLFRSFQDIQRVYAVVGAFIVPLLALALIILNSRAAWVGAEHRNRPLTVLILAATLGFFVWIAVR
ncbi:MAG: Nramp family divalent metal transporter [Gammaproteobacteria bacterium]|nr:Nramp family divalent metal transporter [Gammaproteobacteria bacterium]